MRRTKIDGRAVRSRREALGLSQEALAQKADISLGTLRYIETGRTTTPEKFTFESLVTALGCEAAEITADEDAAGVPA